MTRRLAGLPLACLTLLNACSFELPSSAGCGSDVDCGSEETCQDGRCLLEIDVSVDAGPSPDAGPADDSGPASDAGATVDGGNAGSDAGPDIPEGCDEPQTFPADGFEAFYFALEDDDTFGDCLGVEAIAGEVLAVDWQAAGPVSGATDRFGARFTTRRTLEQGIYTFSLSFDDGLRIFLDGALLFEDWAAHTISDLQIETPLLAAGEHDIVVEYYDDSGAASVAVALSPGCLPPPTQALQAVVTYHPLTAVNGVDRGRCLGTELVSLVPISGGHRLSRSWGTGAPAPLASAGIVDAFAYVATTSYPFRGRTHFLLSHDDGARLVVADSTHYDQLGGGAGEGTLTSYEPRGQGIVEVSGVELSGDASFTLDLQSVCDTAPAITGVSWQALFYRVVDGGGGSEPRSNFTIDYDDCLGETTISELEFVYAPNPLPDFLLDAGASGLWAMELRRNVYPTTGVDWFLDHDDGARVFLDSTLVVGDAHWAAPLIHANATRDVFQFPAFGAGGGQVKIQYFQNNGGYQLAFGLP